MNWFSGWELLLDFLGSNHTEGETGDRSDVFSIDEDDDEEDGEDNERDGDVVGLASDVSGLHFSWCLWKWREEEGRKWWIREKARERKKKRGKYEITRLLRHEFGEMGLSTTLLNPLLTTSENNMQRNK